MHIERLNGVFRDRMVALTRNTHAFTKTARSLGCFAWVVGV